MNVDKIITNEFLENVFQYANFGNVTKRDVVKEALMKAVCGYHNGHTAECIIIELGLCTKKLKLTKKGQEYLYHSFY